VEIEGSVLVPLTQTSVGATLESRNPVGSTTYCAIRERMWSGREMRALVWVSRGDEVGVGEGSSAAEGGGMISGETWSI